MLLAIHCAQAQAGAIAQETPQRLPAFDVASIKPYGSNDMLIRIHTNPDGVSVSGMPMHMILRDAFGVTNDRLLGEPGWVNVERYNVDAKVAPDDAPKLKDLTQAQRWAMLLPVLQDRCQLKFHYETRELTVYTLVVAKGGVKMQPSKPPDGGADQMLGRGPSSAGVTVSDRVFTLTGHMAAMETIVSMISRTIGSTVIDKTGLTGKYDYTLSFAPDENMRAGMLPPPGGGAPPPEADGLSILTAVQEQLGLKLVAQKEPVDVIVIDHIEQPTAN